MDMNELAVEVTKREGGKINLSIAQIKEVLAHLSDIAYESDPSERIYNPILRTVYENGKRRSKING